MEGIALADGASATLPGEVGPVPRGREWNGDARNGL
jgi:hypothetical protein